MSAYVVIDKATDDLMKPLVERGLAAYKKAMMKLPPHKQRIGITNSLCIVTEADYAKHPMLCLRHVLMNKRSLFILCKTDAELCAMMTRTPEERP